MSHHTKTVAELNGLIADFTVFYQKLRHYHWNVKGKFFFQLHAKFEELYDAFNEMIDELAERVVGLNEVPVHTLADVLKTATLKEDALIPSGDAMVIAIRDDMVTLSKALLSAIETAEAAGDRTTVNLLDELRDGIEGHLWMIEATLK